MNMFLMSPQKHMLWVLIRSAFPGTSNEYHKIRFHGEVRNISIRFGGGKKEPYLDLW